MRLLQRVFEQNRAWAEAQRRADPTFFRSLADKQRPEILWIGCADSRVPANQIMGLPPGSVFVHRNVANVVVHSDLNCLSVIQFAVEVLKVKHVIVCGHYACGGVAAAIGPAKNGLIDNWLRHVRDVARQHKAELDLIDQPEAYERRLTELNVREQLLNICQTTIVQDAWERGRELAVHGWVYDVHDGLLRDLDHCIDGMVAFRAAMTGR